MIEHLCSDGNVKEGPVGQCRCRDDWPDPIDGHVPSDEACRASLNLAGEHFGCDLREDHYGWAHSNTAAQAIWGPVPGNDY